MFSGGGPDDPDAPGVPSSSGGRSLKWAYVLTKALRVAALFLTYDMLKSVHLVPGLFLVKLA